MSKEKRQKEECGFGRLHELVRQAQIKFEHVDKIAFKVPRQSKVRIVHPKIFTEIPDSKVERWIRITMFEVNVFYYKEFCPATGTAYIYVDGRVMTGEDYEEMLVQALADFPAEGITLKRIRFVSRPGFRKEKSFGICFRVSGDKLPTGYKIINGC